MTKPLVIARPSDGFTIVELVVVIAILGLIAGIFVKDFDAGNRMFLQVDGRKELLQEGRIVLTRIVREARQVRSANDLLQADASNLAFYSTSDSLVAVSYAGFPGGGITMQRGSVVHALAGGVDSLAFSYYRSDGSAAVPLVSPNATDVYRVEVFLRLVDGQTKVVLKSGTYLRNM